MMLGMWISGGQLEDSWEGKGIDVEGRFDGDRGASLFGIKCVFRTMKCPFLEYLPIITSLLVFRLSSKFIVFLFIST